MLKSIPVFDAEFLISIPEVGYAYRRNVLAVHPDSIQRESSLWQEENYAYIGNPRTH